MVYLFKMVIIFHGYVTNNQMVTVTTNGGYDQLPRLPRYSWREDAIISVGCTLKARAKYRKKSGSI
jgi:hypothetical protein